MCFKFTVLAVFHKHVLPSTLASKTCQIFQDTVPHINISVPLQVMQEQQSLGRDALNTDQTYMRAGMGPKMHECRKECGGWAKRKTENKEDKK